MHELQSSVLTSSVQCIAPMSSSNSNRVLTGNDDKRVYLWDIRAGDGLADFDYRVQALAGLGVSRIQAVAWNAHSRRVLSASGSKIVFSAVEGGPIGKPLSRSTNVFQIHVHPQDPNIIILEVTI